VWTEPCPAPSSLHDLKVAVLAHPAAPFVLEDRAVGFGSDLFERGNLVTLQGVVARPASLAPQDHHFLAGEVELLPFEHSGDLVGPHAVPVREQAHRHVPVPVPPGAARLFDESINVSPLKMSLFSDSQTFGFRGRIALHAHANAPLVYRNRSFWCPVMHRIIQGIRRFSKSILPNLGRIR
jgi:hypothetical protein